MATASETAVIFDMDGVIVHNHYFHVKAWEEFSKRYGISVEGEKLTEMFGGTNEEILPEMFGRPLQKDELNRLAEEKELLYRELYRMHMVETEGLTNFLQSLRKEGIRMAVATSAPPVNADFVIDNLNLKTYFDHITTAADISKGKPDPEIYLLTASRLGISPQNCVVIEDSVRGIRSGLAAGMKVIGITTTNPAGMLGETHHIIGNFYELTPLTIREMITS
jgi:beta-phosphoglucomutase